MVKAIWNGATIAQSDDTVVVEGNHYFPRDAVADGYLKPSATQTICPWKGTAHYYSIVVDGAENPDAAWFYPEPKQAAAKSRTGSPSGKASRSAERAGCEMLDPPFGGSGAQPAFSIGGRYLPSVAGS